MAYGELDLTIPGTAVIVDVQLAPRKRGGHGRVLNTFYILKPIDL